MKRVILTMAAALALASVTSAMADTPPPSQVIERTPSADAATVATVSRWRYSPATQAGAAIAVRKQLDMIFNLN